MKSRIAIFFYVKGNSKTAKLGGAERRMTRILNNLGNEYDVHLILKVEKQNKEIENMFLNIIESCQVKIYQEEKYYDVFKRVIKEKYDVILYTDPYLGMIPFFVAGVVSRAKRIMLNVTTYAAQLTFKSKKQKILFWVVSSLSNQIDTLYPLGQKNLSIRFPRKSVSLCPCAFTDLSLFYPEEKDKSIIFMASLIKDKNPLLFVDAISEIKEYLINNNYKVFLCGSGPLKEDIENRIKIKGCNDIITMTGNIKPESFFPTASIFVSIQNYDNYPSQSLLEAISCGCYIVATNVGSTRSIVSSEYGCLTGYDPVEIGKAILAYMNMDDNKKRTIISNARSFAENNFLIAKSVNHFKQLINDEIEK